MSSRSSLLSSVVIVIVIFGSVGALLFITNPYEPPTIAVVVMDPGFGDLSLADQANLGIENLTTYVSVEYFVPTPYPQTVPEAETLLRNPDGWRRRQSESGPDDSAREPARSR